MAQNKLSKYDPDRIRSRLIELGEDWSDKDAAANLLEETKKSVLAKLANESGAKSAAQAEMLALAHPDYEQHIKSMVEARKIANKARVAYASAQVFIDMMRSVEATKRAEMKL